MTQRRNVRAVLFDWDGTLADTAEAAFRAYARTFGDYGLHYDTETWARTYSPNWQHTYRCMGVPVEAWPEAQAKWLAYFAEERVELIEGAREALEVLERHNILRGIVTSGTRSRIERELLQHDVGRHFLQVICGGDVREKKPHPEALHLCLEKIGVSPEETVYVGDSPEDIQMAHAAGVASIAIRGPYPNVDGLLASSPGYLAESLSDAVNYVLR